MAQFELIPDLGSILTTCAQWGTPDAADSATGALPNRPAVYALLAHDGRLIQLAITQQLRAAVQARVAATAEPRERRADLRAVVRAVCYAEVRDGLEARWLHWRAARAVLPSSYREQLAFGPAEFLLLDAGADIPEARISQQPFLQHGEIVGPFPNRAAAQEALEGLWDLFDLCRYPEQVRRAPHGTRCAYADMGRCDAPCDGAAPLDIYRRRVQDSWEFACGAIAPWVRAAEDRMHAAAADLRFEKAALLKRQLAFAQRWRTQWPAAKPLRRGIYLMLAPVSRRRAWTAYLFRMGNFIPGESLRERDAAQHAVRWAIESTGAPADPATACEMAWLLGHALYSRIADRLATVWIDASTAPATLERELQQRMTYIRPQTTEDAPNPSGEA